VILKNNTLLLITQQQINRLEAGKTIAIAGASRKEKS
jgi:hypothetical protein